jgi:nucleoside-diphosphate-sugar epimerase
VTLLVTGGAGFIGSNFVLDCLAASLFEEANDLLIGKSGLFHSRYSPKLADFVPSLWYGRQGAGQCPDVGF